MLKTFALSICFAVGCIAMVGCSEREGGNIGDAEAVQEYTTPESYDASAESSPG